MLNLTWLNGSLLVSVLGTAIIDPEAIIGTVNIKLTFENGSTGIVAYHADGSKSKPKEYVEVFRSGAAGVIEDFKKAKICGRRRVKKSLFNQVKDQNLMVERFPHTIHEGETVIAFDEIGAVTKASFAVLESLRTILTVRI